MKPIHCPICRQRLFDTSENGKAHIEIKCIRCGKIIKIDLSESTSKTAAG